MKILSIIVGDFGSQEEARSLWDWLHANPIADRVALEVKEDGPESPVETDAGRSAGSGEGEASVGQAKRRSRVAAGTSEPVASAASGGGAGTRRSRAVDQGDDEKDTGDAKAKPTRARRADAKKDAGGTAAKPKAAKGRGGKAAKKISDVALTKAAGEAADTITPAGVKAILEQMGVPMLQELEPERRQEFLDLLFAAVEQEKGE